MLFPCSADSDDCYKAANDLHRAMWLKNFERKLAEVDECEGLTYLPSAEVRDLQLNALGCNATAILVREEYHFTYEELKRHHPNPNIGGMVLTGHPRHRCEFTIEGHGSPCSRTHNMQENLFLCFTYCSVSLAMGCPLPYNGAISFIFLRKMASKSIPAIP